MAETYEALYARISKFETALRAVGVAHGFYVQRLQIDDDRRSFNLEITADFMMVDERGIPARGPGSQSATSDTIRLEEGRHEAL